ncbi:hypothetical protein K1T71_002228 [Dendrolimus kikuchii]|uniref:Uncharacterized protein n=1 Tax=Dendrolimus kikuchii TaxID=765133 RepID=A0ACC1DGG7_9NEOP|nr:hypothetical protein K1T71_002228 [Dendrolimus kikuchii]
MEVKKFTRKEIESRNSTSDAVIIIDNVVYDVTEFLEEHPGGMEVLLENAGKDASECFRRVGHSDFAFEWRQKFVVGEVVDEEKWEVRPREEPMYCEKPFTLSSLLDVWGPPLMLGLFATLVYVATRIRTTRRFKMVEKKFTRKEIVERNTKKDAVFIINNVVYDVTKFLDEHPGGHEVLVNAAGSDATESFLDVGHSYDAKELMRKFVIGEVVDEDRIEVQKQIVSWDDNKAEEESSFFSSWKFPVLLGLVITVLYSYLFA